MEAFSDLPAELQLQIKAVTDAMPGAMQVFINLHEHYEESSKRRKVAGQEPQQAQAAPVQTAAAGEVQSGPSPLDVDHSTTFRELSMSFPERRKSTLLLTNDEVVIVKDKETQPYFRAVKSDFVVCLCLKVPDRSKPQSTFVLVRKVGELVDPVIQFTVNESPDSTLKADLEAAIRQFCPVKTCEDELLTMSAHKGARDGTLFFLDGWIFFGFKKPLLLFEAADVESVAYSSITRLTFNLDLRLKRPYAEGQQYEFSMIDHKHYDAINEWIDANELNNQSLAEERRAKPIAKAEFSNELQMAEAEFASQHPQDDFAATNGAPQAPNADDDDEEDDEDYDAGESDGSDGSGSDEDSDSESDHGYE